MFNPKTNIKRILISFVWIKERIQIIYYTFYYNNVTCIKCLIIYGLRSDAFEVRHILSYILIRYKTTFLIIIFRYKNQNIEYL